jgi:hypothetical protein
LTISTAVCSNKGSKMKIGGRVFEKEGKKNLAKKDCTFHARESNPALPRTICAST